MGALGNLRAWFRSPDSSSASAGVPAEPLRIKPTVNPELMGKYRAIIRRAAESSSRDPYVGRYPQHRQVLVEEFLHTVGEGTTDAIARSGNLLPYIEDALKNAEGKIHRLIIPVLHNSPEIPQSIKGNIAEVRTILFAQPLQLNDFLTAPPAHILLTQSTDTSEDVTQNEVATRVNFNDPQYRNQLQKLFSLYWEHGKPVSR